MKALIKHKSIERKVQKNKNIVQFWPTPFPLWNRTFIFGCNSSLERLWSVMGGQQNCQRFRHICPEPSNTKALKKKKTILEMPHNLNQCWCRAVLRANFESVIWEYNQRCTISWNALKTVTMHNREGNWKCQISELGIIKKCKWWAVKSLKAHEESLLLQ